MNRKELCRIIKDKTRGYANLSFSQEGEDIIVDNLISYKKQGFYVDIGALHPARFSNTMRFYYRGWSGLNVDAMPGSMQLFNKLRPRDINVEAGVSSNGERMIYYKFNEPALNTFDNIKAEKLIKQGQYQLTEKMEVQTYTAMEILDRYIAKNQKIDIMDIDIEGFDEPVINQIDWEKYRPEIVLAEKLDNHVIMPLDVLDKNGYQIVAWTGRTVIYKLKRC